VGERAGECGADGQEAGAGVIERQGQDCEYLLFGHLSRVPRLAHGVFTRRGGFSAPPFDGLNLTTSTGDDPARVGRNRDVAAAALGLPLVSACPVHGAEVIVIDEALAGGWLDSGDSGEGSDAGWGARLAHLRTRLRGVHADAMVTTLPGFALFWAYGDCAPIVLADPHREVVALVHAGWRGAAAAVVKRTVAVLHERFGTSPGDLLAGIGPAIGACCYEVNEAVRAAFAAHPATAETACFVERGDANGNGTRLYLDVAATSERQLLAAGIPARNIETSGYCTGCSPELFYSNRRGPRHGGRFGVGIGLQRD
jgi:YfiH family protein